MNASLFSALLTIASAPVIDPTAPLSIRVTRRCRQTLRAHNRHVPRVHERNAVKTCKDCGETLTGGECLACAAEDPGHVVTRLY